MIPVRTSCRRRRWRLLMPARSMEESGRAEIRRQATKRYRSSLLIRPDHSDIDDAAFSAFDDSDSPPADWLEQESVRISLSHERPALQGFCRLSNPAVHSVIPAASLEPPPPGCPLVLISPPTTLFVAKHSIVTSPPPPLLRRPDAPFRISPLLAPTNFPHPVSVQTTLVCLILHTCTA